METHTVTATIKSIRISPRKMGVVASLVRGRSLEDALTILEHTPRQAAKPLIKLLKSAAANAENNHKLKPSTLAIERLEVGFSERGRRYKPAAHGRALPYQLKHSRVTVALRGEERTKKTDKKAAKPAETKTKAKPKAKKETA